MDADTAAMFARVRANAEKACFEAGDLFEITLTVAIAERAVVGDGPGWVAAMMARNRIEFPLRTIGDGDVEDAAGTAVLQVDPHSERSDDEVAAITNIVVLALNSIAGFAQLTASGDILPESTNLEVAE